MRKLYMKPDPTAPMTMVMFRLSNGTMRIVRTNFRFNEVPILIEDLKKENPDYESDDVIVDAAIQKIKGGSWTVEECQDILVYVDL